MSQHQIARHQAAPFLLVNVAVAASQGMPFMAAELVRCPLGMLRNKIGRCCAARSRMRWP
jgi:hypothetical protein